MTSKRSVARKTLVAVISALLTMASCTSSGEPEPPAEQERDPLPASSFSTQGCDEALRLAKVSRRGLYGYRSPEIVPIPREPNFLGGEATLVHSGPWDYLTNVPFVMYGPGHIEPLGELEHPATMADVAPTTARLIGFDGFKAPDGRELGQALTGASAPRLVVTIVWDGGGYNALERHAGKWPFLEKLMTQDGVSYRNFNVGSNPSVTPSIHTSVGTGAFPRSHGVVGLKMRTKDGRYVNPLGGIRPANMEVPTLSDVYDRARGNRPVTGMLGSTSWHIGMIGHGSSLKGGDKDPVALLEHERPVVKTNESIYSLPKIGSAKKLRRLVEATDAADGKRDGKWLNRSLETQKDVSRTPAAVGYNQYLLEQMIKKEGFGEDEVPDLLYVNFKSADLAGHAWSFNAKEVGLLFEAKDQMLRRLTRFLDRRVGEGRWTMMLTADHGQTAFPKDSGAYPIRGGELANDLNRKFDTDGDDVRLIDRVGASGIYVNRQQAKTNDVGLGEMARWIGDYRLRENLAKGADPPPYYEGTANDRLFSGVMVKGRLAVPDCSAQLGR